MAAWIAGRTFFPMDMMEVKSPPNPAMGDFKMLIKGL